MGARDTAAIRYLQNNEIFADAFNYFVYGGEQVIHPDSLEELDTREIAVPYGGKDGAQQPVQRTRDVIRSVRAMTNRRTAFLLLAVEAQANVNYAMPVRNMVYDALQYAGQVEKAAASLKKSGDYRGVSRDEYLSGFLKEDRLMPVVTLVIYFGAKGWDGPLSVHEMFGEQNAKVLALLPDYKINLIDPATIPDKEFDKFHTTMKEVLSFIKYSRDADKLGELVESDEKFRQLGRAEVNVLNTCVNASLPMQDNEEVLDVCEAIQEIANRAAEKAKMEAAQERMEAVKQAKIEAEKTAKMEAEKERASMLLSNVKSLMEKLNLTKEQSMDILSISEKDRETLMQLL